MKKKAFAVISLVVLLSTVVVSQLCNSANGNPWLASKHPYSKPKLDVDSPVDVGTYSSDNVWLNFTLTKPSDWFTTPDCYISYVTYWIDGFATDNVENETVIVVQDKDVENPPASFSFSFNLEGLTAGTHTLGIMAQGIYEGTGFNTYYPRINFTVYDFSPTPEPTPFEEAGVQNTSQFMVTGGAVALVSIIVFLGLLFYFIKRK